MMKDWKTVELKPLSPQRRTWYYNTLRVEASNHYDPVTILYHQYRSLPAEVAAHLVHLDMQKAGWNDPPHKFIDKIAANLFWVRILFAGCTVDESIEPEDYVDKDNKDEVYRFLLDLHHQDDLKKQAAAAEAFCKSTQMGGH